VAALYAVPLARAASFPPDRDFRTLSGKRITLHYHQGLENMARRALPMAEELLARHESRYRVRVGRVHVVLADVEDEPNGFASPLPYPLVHLRAVSPTGADDLGNYEDWMRLLLTHELAHVVHLDQARGWWRAGRAVLGRAPFLFPNGATPGWTIEGLATEEETEGTAFGRGRDADARMVLRMEALERGLPEEDEPVLALDRWPGGAASYLFGQAFLDDLSRRFGPDTLPRLARAHAGAVLPFLDDVTVRKVTGASLHTRWNEWQQRLGAELEAEAERIAARGLTPSVPLTTRGVRQVRPRWSPDGSWIAYTSRTLTRLREVRVMRADGTGDRRVALRNGGAGLAWTPDGRALVFDEPERHRAFSTRFDLRVVDVGGGRVRRLTRGLRAREPDVSPDGRRVAFVRQGVGGAELALVAWGGGEPRDLTRSEPNTQWSGPRFCAGGAWLVAARWSPGGWLDVVRVDAATGAVEELTRDRAKDVEPACTPDASHVVFRSDRDGVSNVYALRLADRALLRVTNVVGGAFTPEPHPSDGRLAFASYSARGYDVHVTEVDVAALAPAEPFVDAAPPAAPPAEPSTLADAGYRPLPTLRPRFWTPYLGTGEEGVRLGAVTGGSDPLFRHAWLLDASWDTGTRRPSGFLLYQYDRFWPTLLAAAEVHHERATLRGAPANVEDREVLLRATLPVARRLRRAHQLSLSWRRERETVRSGPEAGVLDLGGLEAAWAFTSVRQYPFSISPQDGLRLRVAALKEDPAFGSAIALTKLVADARAYLRLFGETDTLALRVGGGTTVGRPAFLQSYAVGGFPDGSLFDVVRTNQSVLRGYPQDAFAGRRFVHGNLEYRFPLARPQRGWRTFPLFVRHVHAAVFADAAHAWSAGFEVSDLKTAVGGTLSADVYAGHGLPLTATVGLARGLSERGETRVYFRAGLAF
jgi:Tol biopolymer transport system component